MRARALATTLGFAGALFLARQWLGGRDAPRGGPTRAPSAAPAIHRAIELAESSVLSDSRRGAGIELVLVEGNTVGGRVIHRDGQPAANVNVEISGPGESRSTWTDTTGRFLGEGLGDGPFAVKAKSPADGSASPLVRAVAAGELDLELVLLVPLTESASTGCGRSAKGASMSP